MIRIWGGIILGKCKVGLALGAGGAKGLAHLGVLDVLEKANIPIHFIAGSSIGAVIGSFYAAGTRLDLLIKLAQELKNNYLIDFCISKMGLIKGKKAEAIIRLMTHNKNFKDLNIPLAVVATDLITGERVVFREGNVAQAVRASIAVPGVFQPVIKGDKILVDGAVIDHLPAQIVREMGADLVIAVDLQYYNSVVEARINNIFDVIMQSIEIIERNNREKYLPYTDIVIKPKVSNYPWTDFEAAEEIIIAGKVACEEVLDEIKLKLNSLKG